MPNLKRTTDEMITVSMVMPETGFRRRPRAERANAFAEMRTTAVTGARYAWAAPVIVLLAAADLFMGASSEAFDRLKEAHFLRDVGLPGEMHPQCDDCWGTGYEIDSDATMTGVMGGLFRCFCTGAWV